MEKEKQWKKNDLFQVEIEDMGSTGEGIGHTDGFTWFIKDAVIGDIVEAKALKVNKNFGFARLEQVLTPSQFRTEPVCPIYRQCGGCQIQALRYDKQLEWKQNKILNHLKRIGKLEEIPMLPIIGMDDPYHYRNKAQFPVGKDKDGNLVAGFYAGRTHSIIPTTKCYLGVEENEAVLNAVLSYMKECGVEPYDEKTLKGIVRHVLIRYGFRTKEIMVCLVINSRRIPEPDVLLQKLKLIHGMKSVMLNVNRDNTNVILGDSCVTLWGSPYITDFIGDISFQISPPSFYQVNPIQTEKLYSLALSFAELTGEEIVWDLYCGIGTISLFLAKKAKKVYGVEIVPQAIADAKENAERNGIQNTEFFVGRAEEVLPEKFEQTKEIADVIVVDPPRKGCDQALLDTILQMAPNRVVYVSCDSATLARDLRYLCDGGYEVRKVRGVDQFGMTVHVECVVLMSRKDK